jgi:hypothetical protein
MTPEQFKAIKDRMVVFESTRPFATAVEKAFMDTIRVLIAEVERLQEVVRALKAAPTKPLVQRKDYDLAIQYEREVKPFDSGGRPTF